ncbi:hypothetical protein [Cohnella yongneupensis]|uniref:Immunity protein 63 domain-containing protein n=1 Tax=Cohnella yongneupensis TaxID=425006 RepID=A0ABW0QZ46_9BACL
MSIMPLRIPAGYAITYNKFYDIDPIIDERDKDRLSNSYYFTEDILQIHTMVVIDGNWVVPEKEKFIIDLGWYPECTSDGDYKLVVVDDHWNEIRSLRSRDRLKIKDTLETWLKEIVDQKLDGFK